MIAAAAKIGASLLTSLAAIAGCQGGPTGEPTCQEGYDVVDGFCVPVPDYSPAPVPTTPSVIVVWESVGATGPVDPPTRLDMWMEDTDTEGGPRVRCLNRGGTPTPEQGLILCVGIDY